MLGTATTPLAEYKQPKMWKDLTTEEKLERVREQVKHLEYRCSACSQTTESLKNDFQNHSHSEGKVVKDVKTYSSSFGSAKLSNPEAEAKGEVYF